MATHGASASSSKQSTGDKNTQEKLQLTVGCEIECVLVVNSSKPVDGKGLIRKVLCGNDNDSLKVRCALCNTKHSFPLPLWLGKADEETATNWIVGSDVTARPMTSEIQSLGTHKESYQFFDIEIRSRILHLDKNHPTVPCASDDYPPHKRGERHEITYKEEIKGVLDLLHRRLCRFDRKTRTQHYLYVNQNCGLHIHLGNGPAGDLSFERETIQRVFAAHLACERQIDGLHAQSRITGTNLSTNELRPSGPVFAGYPIAFLINTQVFNRPPSLYFILAAHNRRCSEMNTTSDIRDAQWRCDAGAWVKLISEATTLAEVGKLYSNQGRNCNINLQGVLEPDVVKSQPKSTGGGDLHLPLKPPRLTIEFRQHAGTLQADAIVAYIDFLTKLVTFCHESSDKPFYQQFGKDGVFRDPGLDTLNLCYAMGCFPETFAYYKNHLGADNGTMPKRMHDLGLLAATADSAAGDPLASLIFSNAQAELEDIHPARVKDRITNKLISGGYGQFSAEDLQALLPGNIDPRKREQLQLGYIEANVQPRAVAPPPQTFPNLGAVIPGYSTKSDFAPPQVLRRMNAPGFVSPSASLAARLPPRPVFTVQLVDEPFDMPTQNVSGQPQQHGRWEGSVAGRSSVDPRRRGDEQRRDEREVSLPPRERQPSDRREYSQPPREQRDYSQPSRERQPREERGYSQPPKEDRRRDRRDDPPPPREHRPSDTPEGSPPPRKHHRKDERKYSERSTDDRTKQPKASSSSRSKDSGDKYEKKARQSK